MNYKIKSVAGSVFLAAVLSSLLTGCATSSTPSAEPKTVSVCTKFKDLSWYKDQIGANVAFLRDTGQILDMTGMFHAGLSYDLHDAGVDYSATEGDQSALESLWLDTFRTCFDADEMAYLNTQLG
jgi:hypothetical protein